MSAPKPFLLMLIGPKGAGKTHLARVIEANWRMPYLHIEPIWQQLQRERTDFASADYIAEGLTRTLDFVAQELSKHPRAILDGTGAFPAFADYLARLHALAQVCLVKVVVPAEVSLERVQSRYQREQVQMDMAAVARMNAVSAALELPWQLVLHNHPPLQPSQLIAAVQPILGAPHE